MYNIDKLKRKIILLHAINSMYKTTLYTQISRYLANISANSNLLAQNFDANRIRFLNLSDIKVLSPMYLRKPDQ